MGVKAIGPRRDAGKAGSSCVDSSQGGTGARQSRRAGNARRCQPRTLNAPPGWTSDETASGNYRTLNLRSRVPGLFLYVEVGTRSTPVPTPIPIDWRGAERRLKAKYGTGYRRISLGSGTLGGQLAGVWEYELDKPGGPRLHKRLIGSVSGWNSTVFATTAPRGNFKTWQTVFDSVMGSLSTN